MQLYADESSSYTIVEDAEHSLKQLNKDLDKWAYHWKMVRNPNMLKKGIEIGLLCKNEIFCFNLTFENIPVAIEKYL